MSNDQKIIKNKVGLLKLAETLGSVSEACKVLGYSRDSSTASRSCTRRAAN
jgi:molybdenum-dependent DNA-binding transcriptional regulator ModE